MNRFCQRPFFSVINRSALRFVFGLLAWALFSIAPSRVLAIPVDDSDIRTYFHLTHQSITLILVLVLPLTAAFIIVYLEMLRRKRIEKALRLDEQRLEALLTLSQKTEVSLQELMDFSLNQGVQLTGSKIGYLAFLNEDETALTMQAWSKNVVPELLHSAALTFPVETSEFWGDAIRQRETVIVNNYSMATPLKRGQVRIVCYMSTPVFDGERIVAVAGVANKDREYDQSDARQLTLLMQGMWRLVQRKQAEEELVQHRLHLEELVAQRSGELQRTNEQLVQEITEHQAAQKALELEAQKLVQSNAELEQFAYVASHDLQEPLRMVSSFVQLLERRYTDKLDADAHDFITFAAEGAQRMHALLNDLLTYSRLNVQSQPNARLSTEQMLERVINRLRDSIQETNTVIRYGPLPEITGNAEQFGLLFLHLLDNAIKFRGEQRPEIDISAQRDGAEWIFSVHDNGIGIPSEYHERIFRLFQRLHPRGKYAGTGMGLAVCKRIVERHNGRIWVESGEGQGTTFLFTVGLEGNAS